MISIEAKKGALIVMLLSLVIGINTFSTTYGIIITWSLYILGIVISCILGALIYIKIALDISPPIKQTEEIPKILETFHNAIIECMKEVSDENSKKTPDSKEVIAVHPVFSRNIDKEINILLQKFMNEYILSWLGPLISDEKSKNEIQELIRYDFWETMKRLNERLSKIDKVNFLACEITKKVTEHFERIRFALHQNQAEIQFTIHKFITSEEREIEFLAKVADILILFLLPKSYLSCLGTRSTIRELLSRHVLYFVIDSITDPNNINSILLQWVAIPEKKDVIKERISQENRIQLDISNANSYEEFIISLKSSNDIESLKQQRSNILTEIVQATTFDHLTKVKGVTKDENLSEYVTQLVKAKTICEVRLEELGMVDEISKSSLDTIDGFEASGKDLSFVAIMNSPFSRRYFYAFLEQQGKQDLLGFWAAVEELKESEKIFWHQLATEIFYTYINKPTRVIRMSRSWLKQIELFLMGDSGPDIFYEIQNDVRTNLETDFYPVFLISDQCYNMLEEAHDNNISFPENNLVNESGPLIEDLDSRDSKRSSIDNTGSTTTNCNFHTIFLYSSNSSFKYSFEMTPLTPVQCFLKI